MVVTWTRRNDFIEYAAKIVADGKPLELAFDDIGQYAEPYRRGTPPVLGPKQMSAVKICIMRRVWENERS